MEAMDISSWIDHWADRGFDRVALHFEGQDITYKALAQRIHRIAAALSAVGVAPGDRVAYLGHNSPEYMALVFAVARLGAMLTPLNFRLMPHEHAYQLSRVEPKVVVATAEYHDHLESIRNSLPSARLVSADNAAASSNWQPLADLERSTVGKIPPASVGSNHPLLIIFTSGTTGQPKGAVLSQRALTWHAVNSALAHGLSYDDRVLTVLPMFHAGGLNIQTLPALHAGATVIIHRKAEAEAFFDAVQQHQPTLTLMVPPLMQSCVQHVRWKKADLSSLRLVMAGSAPVPYSLIEAFHAKGVPVGQVYGCTEVTAIATSLGRHDAMRKVGSAGKPPMHGRIRVVDDAGRDVAPGAAGEILVSSPTLMEGYWRDLEATNQTITGGWLHTGDLGSLDDEGYLFINGRKKDMLISGGYNVYPAEIEAVLLELPFVAECAVVGINDQRWGEVPVAAIVATRDSKPSVEEVTKICDARLAKYKRPRHVIFVEELPHNSIGKVQKHVLKEKLDALLPK